MRLGQTAGDVASCGSRDTTHLNNCHVVNRQVDGLIEQIGSDTRGNILNGFGEMSKRGFWGTKLSKFGNQLAKKTQQKEMGKNMDDIKKKATKLLNEFYKLDGSESCQKERRKGEWKDDNKHGFFPWDYQVW